MRILRLVEERHHRDADGRPIREGRTPAEHLRPDDIEYKQCQYPGSRYLAGPINVSALKQTSEHWDGIVDALAGLRARYAEIRGAYGPDVMDVWRVSQLACALPWHAILTRGETASAPAAALSKITLGTALLAQRLLHDAMLQRWVPPPLTADSLMQLAESTGTLLAEREACAAPAKMIVDFLEVLVAGKPAPRRLIDDDVLVFGAHYTGFKLLLWIHFLARRFLYADVGAAEHLALPCEPPDCEIIEPPDLRLPPPLRAMWFGALAALVAPIAPDGSDQVLADLARDIARIMGAAGDARATYVALDANLGEVMRAVERGFGGTPPDVIDAAMRDRLVGGSPRDVLGAGASP